MAADTLQAENAELRRQLEEAEETIRAIQSGAVDAVVVQDGGRSRVYTLEAADRPYRLFVEQMQQGAATLLADGTIVYCNRQLADLMKVPHEKLIGAGLHSFIAADDRAIYDNLLRQGQTRFGRAEARLRRADGGLVPTYLTFNALPKESGAAVGVLITDLTAQRHHEQLAAALDQLQRSEAELRESEARFRNMADHAPVMIWITEPRGSRSFLSQSWYDFTGKTPGSGLGFGWLEAMHADDRASAERTFHAANAKREAFRLEYRLRRHDGAYRWAINAATPRFGETGEFLGYIGSIIDITDRKQAEETQQLLVGELNHRVKNTLASVQAIVQHTLRQTRDPQEFATSFVGRIQSMARVHSMLSAATWQGADLRGLIRDQLLNGPVDETRIRASGPPVHLQPHMALHTALMLHELGTNANKYGALSAPSGWVTVGWTVEDGWLHLRWEERGGPAVSAPTKRGFGTSLIEQSAKGEGGSTHMSVAEEGITWKVKLPLRGPATIDAANPSTLAVVSNEPVQVRIAEPDARKLAGRRFLVVEDEPLVALDITAGLEDAGAEVVASTGSAKEALEIVESRELDAALLDGNLHGRPVGEIAAALTRHKVPFVFVTGYGREGLPQAFRNASMLSKPFNPQQLIEAAAGLVERRSDVVHLREN
jgi:PAS domain S-box-containing protein